MIYAENKVGWLNDFIMLLKSDGIHILAISVLIPVTPQSFAWFQTIPKDLARLLKSQSSALLKEALLRQR